jgi:hypothetical protein
MNGLKNMELGHELVDRDWKRSMRIHLDLDNSGKMDLIKKRKVMKKAKKKLYPIQTVQPSCQLKIIILQRGWVMVGRLEKNGSECKLHNASVIRIWGTKKGLGEIAGNGPTKDTVLDKCYGVVEFDYLTVVASISVEESKWAKEL